MKSTLIFRCPACECMSEVDTRQSVYVLRLEAVANAAKEHKGWRDARQHFTKCHSVDGHGMRGYCDCHWKEQVTAEENLGKVLAALENE